MEETTIKSEGTRLFVGGIPYRSTEQGLKEHFSQAGTVTFATIMMERETGRSKGYGFVEMSNMEEAQKAIAMFHDQEFDGRRLTVNLANPKKPRTDGDRPRRAI